MSWFFPRTSMHSPTGYWEWSLGGYDVETFSQCSIFIPRFCRLTGNLCLGISSASRFQRPEKDPRGESLLYEVILGHSNTWLVHRPLQGQAPSRSMHRSSLPKETVHLSSAKTVVSTLQLWSSGLKLGAGDRPDENLFFFTKCSDLTD